MLHVSVVVEKKLGSIAKVHQVMMSNHEEDRAGWEEGFQAYKVNLQEQVQADWERAKLHYEERFEAVKRAAAMEAVQQANQAEKDAQEAVITACRRHANEVKAMDVQRNLETVRADEAERQLRQPPKGPRCPQID